MPTTREDIKQWLERAESKSATHMIVATDTFDYEDYPVFVAVGEDVHERIRHFQTAPMSKVMEVYNLAMPIDDQLAERRAWHP